MLTCYIYLLSFPQRRGNLIPIVYHFKPSRRFLRIPLTYLIAKSPTDSWNTIKPAESPQTPINPPGFPACPGSWGLDPRVCKKRFVGHKMEVKHKKTSATSWTILYWKKALHVYINTYVLQYNLMPTLFSQPLWHQIIAQLFSKEEFVSNVKCSECHVIVFSYSLHTLFNTRLYI